MFILNPIISVRVDECVDLISKAIDLVNDEIMLQIEQEQQPQPSPQKEQLPQKQSIVGRLEQSQVIKDVSKIGDWETIRTNKHIAVRMDPLPPDMFVIQYNENEKAYILERKVKMPILGRKIEIQHMNGEQRHRQEVEQKINEKQSHVYYIYEDANQMAEVKKNRLPHLGQKKHHKEQQDQGQQKRKANREINKSFSYSQNNQEIQNALIPQFVEEQEWFKPVNENKGYSSNIEMRRRLVDKDIPLNILHGRFDKVIGSKGGLKEIGRINKQEQMIKTAPMKQIDQEQMEMLRSRQLVSEEQRELQNQVLRTISNRPFSQLHNTSLTFKQQEQLLETRHIWEKVLSWEEIQELRQEEDKFYGVMELLRLKFNQEHRSEYLKQLRLEFNYVSRRDELGGVITPNDKVRFQARIEQLMERDEKRKLRREKRRKQRKVGTEKGVMKQRNWQIKRQFKNRQARLEYREMFINKII